MGRIPSFAAMWSGVSFNCKSKEFKNISHTKRKETTIVSLKIFFFHPSFQKKVADPGFPRRDAKPRGWSNNLLFSPKNYRKVQKKEIGRYFSKTSLTRFTIVDKCTFNANKFVVSKSKKEIGSGASLALPWIRQ